MKKVKLTFNYQYPPGKRQNPGEDEATYPLLPIRFYYDGVTTPQMEGLLDSGCDSIFLPKQITKFLKLPLGDLMEAHGIDGPCKAYPTKIGLIIGIGGKARECDFGIVDAVIPIEERDTPILIGRQPVFDEYQIVFEQYRGKILLIPKEDVIKKKKSK
jgi:hypothetical protein